MSRRRDPVRATRLEHIRALAGDQLIPKPIAYLTHAITVRYHRSVRMSKYGSARANAVSACVYFAINERRQRKDGAKPSATVSSWLLAMEIDEVNVTAHAINER
jgi:hypothetical protein